jgi:hypothetical protein
MVTSFTRAVVAILDVGKGKETNPAPVFVVSALISILAALIDNGGCTVM